MKIEEYIKNLQEIADKHPNLDVIYATDDEGNDYSLVSFTPTIGQFSKGRYSNGEWLPEEHFEEADEPTVNAVCIN